MRKFSVPLLIFFMLLVFNGIQREGIYEVRASPEIHQGDIILQGGNVTIIEGRFDINGSIIVEENATLILEDAIVNFTQTENYEHHIILQNPTNGNPHLFTRNATITSNHYFMIQLNQNSSATLFNTTLTAYLRAYDSATVNVTNSAMEFLDAYGSSFVSVYNSSITNMMGAAYSSTLTITNSTVDVLFISSTSVNCSHDNIGPNPLSFWNYYLNSSVVVDPSGEAPDITIQNTNINNWALSFHGSSNVTITDSTLSSLESLQDSQTWLINTHASAVHVNLQSSVYAFWYLDVHVVDSIGQAVPSANVTVTYPNSQVAESVLTGFEGCAWMALLGKTWNATGEYPVGNYSVSATYDIHLNATTVNMTESHQITLKLADFLIPEIPSLILLPLFMVGTLLAVIIYRKSNCLHL